MVDTACKCYDCKHLFAALRNSPHSLASTTEFLLRTLTEESKEPPLEKSTTATAAVTQAEIDAEYIRSLELQFAKQKLEADQTRARK